MRDMTIKHSKHDVSGGGLCTDDGSGCCDSCGVAMSECPTCGGIGYHFNGCADGDDDIETIHAHNEAQYPSRRADRRETEDGRLFSHMTGAEKSLAMMRARERDAREGKVSK